MGLSIGFVYLIVALLFADRVAAFFAAWLFALTPQQLVWSASAAVEPSASAACLAALFAAVCFVRVGSTVSLLGVVVATAYAIQFRPESLLIVPVVALLIWQRAPQEFTRPRLWWAGLLFLALAAVHVGHTIAVRNEGWGTTQARMSLGYVAGNLPPNGWFYLADPRFPAVYTGLALLGLSDRRGGTGRLTMACYFVLFFGMTLVFYAGSYNYGADVRYSLATYPPLMVLGGLGLARLVRQFEAARRGTLTLVGPAAAVMAQFLWYLPAVRATTDAAWAARADMEFASSLVPVLRGYTYVLTQNPGMFQVWGSAPARRRWRSPSRRVSTFWPDSIRRCVFALELLVQRAGSGSAGVLLPDPGAPDRRPDSRAVERKSTVRPIPVKGASVGAWRLPGPALASFKNCMSAPAAPILTCYAINAINLPRRMLTTTGSSLRMPVLLAAVLALLCSIPASAQSAPPIQGTTTTTGELTIAGTVSGMVKPIAAPHTGDALNFDTILEVGTMPLAASSSGFTIKLDPSTGLQVRTATTFGPSFAERALTTGEGGVNVGVSFMNSSFTRLGSQSLSGMQVRSVSAPSPLDSRSGTINFTETATTILINGRMGVSDKLDIGVDLPLVTVKVNGSTSLANGRGDILTYATGSDQGSGLGDIAGLVKYRFHSFGDSQPDPGGLAVMATLRFPTGSTDSLRGMGVTRTMVSFIASGGQARFRPHANVGYEFWSDSVKVVSDATAGGSTVEARNQLQYAAGFEFEAAPKATLLLDLVGGQIFGGGKLAFQADPSPAAGATSSSSLVALPEGLARINLAPGLKVNLKGKMLLSLSALIAMKNDGLHARVTPLAGIDITF